MREHHPIPEDMRTLIEDLPDGLHKREKADASSRLPILDAPSADLLDEANALFRSLVLEEPSCC